MNAQLKDSFFLLRYKSPRRKLLQSKLPFVLQTLGKLSNPTRFTSPSLPYLNFWTNMFLPLRFVLYDCLRKLEFRWSDFFQLSAIRRYPFRIQDGGCLSF